MVDMTDPWWTREEASKRQQIILTLFPSRISQNAQVCSQGCPTAEDAGVADADDAMLNLNVSKDKSKGG
jgi:hypothetical protein